PAEAPAIRPDRIGIIGSTQGVKASSRPKPKKLSSAHQRFGPDSAAASRLSSAWLPASTSDDAGRSPSAGEVSNPPATGMPSPAGCAVSAGPVAGLAGATSPPGGIAESMALAVSAPGTGAAAIAVAVGCDETVPAGSATSTIRVIGG